LGAEQQECRFHIDPGTFLLCALKWGRFGLESRPGRVEQQATAHGAPA
jgi:hypothetical protein